jgi:hypothetical protein
MKTMRWFLGTAAAGRRAWTVGALGLGMVAGCGTAGEPGAVGEPGGVGEQAAALTRRDCDNPNPVLFEKDARPFGVSMETWAERNWRWLMSVPAERNPNVTVGADCREGQSGPVFFLPFVPPGADGIGSCTIPPHKLVALNLVSVFNDYPCPDPTFQPAPGQTLFDFLSTGSKEGLDAVAEIDASLDGQPLREVLSYRVASDDLMYFKGDVSLQQPFDACITGSRQAAAVDSYFMVFKPLPPGLHTVELRYVSTSGKITGPRTKSFTVLRD